MRVVSIISSVLWPLIAPVVGQKQIDQNYNKLWWVTVCILNIIPVTAAFHHLVFYPPTCMLNPFGPDYDLKTTLMWLSKDPSLPWAILCMYVCIEKGRYYQFLRILSAPIFISFLPLSLWIWDIPFTGRFICSNFHDDKVMLYAGYMLRTRYFYILGALIYLTFVLSLLYKHQEMIGKIKRVK